MAYVSVADWRPEQVTEWLKGLDNCLLPYLHRFNIYEVNGQQLLHICPDDLIFLGVKKIGHQEIILEGVQHLQNFHYELDRENLQSLALRVACTSKSVFSEVRQELLDQTGLSPVPTYILSDVTNVIKQVRYLVSWLERTPFSGQPEYDVFKKEMLSLCLKMGTSAHRDRFADDPLKTIYDCSEILAKLADSIIQDSKDPMILQPPSLDLATLKKRAGEDLGFFLVPSYHGEHQVGDMKLSSPAHQSGKIQPGDEVVQVNYQTVVGWARKKVIALFEESPNDLLLTLKRRPRHLNMYGQIYIKPYRLPSRKRTAPYSRWNENLPSPRPDFLTIPQFVIPRRPIPETKQTVLEDSVTSSSSDEEFPPPHSSSPTSMRLYLPKPRAPIQRRFTLSGPPRPSAQTEQFWRELQLERSWRSNQNNSQTGGGKDSEVEVLPMREKCVSEGATVAIEKLAEKSAVTDVRNIIELNKVKRDAFFSDMGCPSKPAPSRGRLDKSRSTPAYDLGEPEPRDDRHRSRDRSPKELDRESSSQLSGSERNSKCIDQTPPVAELVGKDPDTPSPSPRARTVWESAEGTKGANCTTAKPWGYEQSRSGTDQTWNAAYGLTDSQSIERFPSTSGEHEHGQMVNTINQTLRRDRDDDVFFSDVPPAPREIRPVPAQRKLTLPPAPLPPKPKPRPLPPEPPEPPPRPDVAATPPSPGPPTPTLSISTERERSSKNTLDHLKAMWTLGRNSSPRAARKHNAILARRRHVAVKDILPGDVAGVLWHRRRRGQSGWTQGFFVLQGPAFYGFRHKERTRADLFIFLPGFTCSVAEEVKSKSYAFKIYHTGTVFYFAAESEEELQQWLDGASLATASSEDARSGDSLGWSETDSGSSDTEPPPDSCFPSRSKLLGAPARSHQNLTSDSNKCESPRKFSSLKKLSSAKPATDGTEAASLDRKYLKFLPHKTTPVPVRTSQFRSYRRMPPPPAPPRPAPQAPTNVHLEPPRLIRRSLHSSNPSLINPDMADYRITQERLREFRNLRNQGRPIDLSGFMTLEQFMLSRQEEERSLRAGRQSRTRVYPASGQGAAPDTRSRVSDITPLGQSEKPQVMPRNLTPGTKIKLQPASPSASAQSSSTSTSEDLATEQRRGKQLPPKPPQTTALPDYPGIEYPPAFEPETYTLQYMLKNRRKREAANK